MNNIRQNQAMKIISSHLNGPAQTNQVSPPPPAPPLPENNRTNGGPPPPPILPPTPLSQPTTTTLGRIKKKSPTTTTLGRIKKKSPSHSDQAAQAVPKTYAQRSSPVGTTGPSVHVSPENSHNETNNDSNSAKKLSQEEEWEWDETCFSEGMSRPQVTEKWDTTTADWDIEIEKAINNLDAWLHEPLSWPHAIPTSLACSSSVYAKNTQQQPHNHPSGQALIKHAEWQNDLNNPDVYCSVWL
jgi:hypothetical protein